MPRFAFRLQTLLSLRQASLDEAQGQLLAAQAEEQAAYERLVAFEQELNAEQQRCRAQGAPGEIDLDDLRTVARYCATLRGEVQTLAQREKCLAAATESRRETLLAADREVQILRKLRERHHAAFQSQQALAEVKQFDEVAARLTGALEKS